MTDRQLLLRYSNERDQSAFTELARRHGGMVHATARRIVKDDADDVAQAVFILLSQKAARLTRHENLAGWLYKVTRYCCNNAMRARARQAKQLQAIREAAMNQQAQHSNVSDLLDEGLDRLGKHERQVVLLRYLEGQSLEQTAQQLDISSDAVAKRAQRGLNKLRDFFTGRGYSISPALLLAAMESQIGAISNSLLAPASSGSALKLAAMTGKTMLLAKLQIAAMLLVATAGITTAVAVATSSPAPAPAAAAPAVTLMGARTVAQKFLEAMRDRDAQAMASLMNDPTAVQRLAKAGAYILQFRDRDFARYPQRLGPPSGTVTMTSSDNPAVMADAHIYSQSPTLADTQRINVHLQTFEGQWKVVDVSPSSIPRGDERVADDDLALPKMPRAMLFVPAIEVTLAWDNTKFTLPAVMKVPEDFWQSPAFKRWQQIKSDQTFLLRDEKGDLYKIECRGMMIGKDGKEHPWISAMHRFHPDGALAATTSYDDNLHALEHAELDATGLRYTTRLAMGRGANGTVLNRVEFYDADQNQRVWQVSPKGVAWREVLNDPIGKTIRVLHPGYYKEPP